MVSSSKINKFHNCIKKLRKMKILELKGTNSSKVKSKILEKTVKKYILNSKNQKKVLF